MAPTATSPPYRDRENALRGDHDEAGNPQRQTGQDDLPLQEHIPGFQPQNGLAPREEPQNPHRAHRLTQNGGNGRPGHAHVKDENENGVEDNVDHRADDRGQHTGSGEALGGDEGVHAHHDQHEHAAKDIDSSVLNGVGKRHVAAAEQPDKRWQCPVEHSGQNHRQKQQNGKAVGNDLFGGVPVALAHGDGRPGCAARSRQHGKGGNEHQNGGEQPHTGERRAADLRNVADVNSIDHVI